MVHSSLSSLGKVLGGAPAVVRALLAALGRRGTLVIPAFSPEVSDPAHWADHSFADADAQRARAYVPAFDADTTPTTMGLIPETFRRWPGTIHGPHPQVSVCAFRPQAEEIVAPHALKWGQGAGSPFQRLVIMDAGLLLLGVGFNRATLLHYAESLVPHGRRKTRRIPFGEGDARRWVEAPCVGGDLRARPEINALIRSKISEPYQGVKVIEFDHLSPDDPLIPISRRSALPTSRRATLGRGGSVPPMRSLLRPRTSSASRLATWRGCCRTRQHSSLHFVCWMFDTAPRFRCATEWFKVS